MLTGTGRLVNNGATLLYCASKDDCEACPMKPRCSPKTPARKVPRSIYESARDRARDIVKTEEGRTSRKLRKKVEMLFAHLKAYPAPRPAPVTRTEWRSRRVPSRSHSPEPQEAGPDKQTSAQAVGEFVRATRGTCPARGGSP